MRDAAIVVGIDEAGYGPVLGPLVVSAAAFELPAARAGDCLWRMLQQSVSPKAAAGDGRIPILDSKKLYHRKDGLARLEKSVLSVVGAWRGLPPTLHGLLSLLCPDALAGLREYPWYCGANPALPRAADRPSLGLAAHILGRDSRAQGIRIAGLWSEILLEGHFNRLVACTRNKAVVLSGLTMRLMQRVAAAHAERQLFVHIDKQGGRAHYAPLLLQAFDGRRLKVLEETKTHSAYELVAGPAAWRISFSENGESRHLAVALASLVSKYVRELLMGCFNDYWTRRVPELEPTAGYYEDAMRFLRDVRPHLGRLGIAAQQLVRQR